MLVMMLVQHVGPTFSDWSAEWVKYGLEDRLRGPAIASITASIAADMKHEIAIADAKARLSELLRLVADGEVVTLTRYGRPAAAIVGAEQATRLAGEGHGKLPRLAVEAERAQVSKGPAPSAAPPAAPSEAPTTAAVAAGGAAGPVDQAKMMVLRRIEVDRQRLPKALQPVMVLIRENVVTPGLTLRRIKAVLGVGSNNVTTRFRQVTGAPIRRYLEDRRLECACRLLVETELGIGEVGRLVGYGPVKSFSAAFRRRIGVRPGSYRGLDGTLSPQAAASKSGAASELPSPLRVPRYLLGVAAVAPAARCGNCDGDLAPEEKRRVFEDLAPICDGCAERRAPELASGL